LVELIGREEAQNINDEQRALLRLVTPIAKLLTAKQAVAVVSEAIEAFGGAGYVEDTGLPVLLRDTQVLSIWEGTTNVLALDALLRSDISVGLKALFNRVRAAVQEAPAELGETAVKAIAALDHAAAWLTANPDARLSQSGARRFAFTLGRALELALLVEHARGAAGNEGSRTAFAAVRRFGALPIDFIRMKAAPEDSAVLAQ
jgi:hypothetical protein